MYPVDMLKVRDLAGALCNSERRADRWPDENASHQPRTYSDIPKLHRQCPCDCFEGGGIQVFMEGTFECHSRRW